MRHFPALDHSVDQLNQLFDLPKAVELSASLRLNLPPCGYLVHYGLVLKLIQALPQYPD